MATTAVGGPVAARPRAPRPSFRAAHETRIAWLFPLPRFVGFVVFYAFPALRGFYLSFTDFDLLKNSGHWIGLDNYKQMFQDALFWNSLRVTFEYVIINIGIQ